MGATYTRQSSAGIVDGGVIEATDLNNEFDQLLATFVAASGHTHDGTAAEGGPVTKLLGTSLTIGDGTAGTDIAVTFDGETNDGVITWMEDEDLFKFSDDINVGVDDAGYDVKFFGDTASRYWLWDTSADGVIQRGTLTVGVDDAGHDVKFFGDTASAYMLWDTSADDLVLAGAAGIDLAGDIDVDGTANLDVVDIDGAVQLDATFTVGEDDQGYDIKFFGDTASAYMLWDTSADDLVFAGSAGIDLAGDIDVDGTSNLDNTDIDGTFAVDGATISLDATTSLNIDNSNTSNGITIATATSGVPISIGHSTSETTVNDNLTVTGDLSIGGNFDVTGTIDLSDSDFTNAGDIQLDSITGDGDTNTSITFSGSDVITITAGGDTQVTFNNGSILPTTDNDIDLGSASYQFKDAYINGTLEADAITIGGTAIGSIYGAIAGSSSILTTGALDSGSITSGFGSIDNGTSGIRTNTFTAETSVVPSASDGAALGTAALEWSDLFLADGAVINLGDDQDITLTHVADTGINIKNTSTSGNSGIGSVVTLQTGDTDIASGNILGEIKFQAPDEATGTDAILIAAGIAAVSEGDFSSSNNATKLSFKTGASEAAAEKMSLSSGGNLAISGDLTVSGDDLFMSTNTSGAALIGDGTNFNPVAISGDLTIGSDGTAAIGSAVIVNADVSGSAAIADSKLDTISTANKVGLAALDIDGGTDIGAALTSTDLIVVDDGAGGTNRKAALSRLTTYMTTAGFVTEDPTALAIALG